MIMRCTRSELARMPTTNAACSPQAAFLFVCETRGILPRFRSAPEKRGFRALPRQRCALSRRHIHVPDVATLAAAEKKLALWLG